MPLFKSKSKKAFSHNVKEEAEEGKPQKQALAIAYSMKRKKKASGGTVESGDSEMNYAEGGKVSSNKSRQNFEKGVHESASDDMSSDKGTSMAGHAARKGHQWSNQEHRRVLDEMKKMPNPQLKAEGGEVDPTTEVTCPHCAKSFSHGGQVANSDEPVADFMPNEFDDLHLRDDLDSSYTGANSGDELGNEQEDEDRKDLVSRAMIKRRAKKND